MKKFIDNLGNAFKKIAMFGIGVVLFCVWIIACYWVGCGIGYIVGQIYFNH